MFLDPSKIWSVRINERCSQLKIVDLITGHVPLKIKIKQIKKIQFQNFVQFKHFNVAMNTSTFILGNNKRNTKRRRTQLLEVATELSGPVGRYGQNVCMQKHITLVELQTQNIFFDDGDSKHI